MKRSRVILARLSGLPTRLRRRTKRSVDFLWRIYVSAIQNGQLWQVICRVPGARIDPHFNPDKVKKFAPINACIYCGETDINKLEREHILAYCLGGDAQLPKASCRCCARKTSKIEEYCGDLFLDVKILSKTHSRRPAETHLSVHDRSIASPPYLPAKQFIPTDEHPGLLALPMFDPPGFVMGRAPSNEFTNVETWYRLVAEDAEKRLRDLSKKIRTPTFGVIIDLDMFARFIAKTAHCIAVADYGIKKFRPLLIDIILEGKENRSYFVGCPTTRLPESVPMKTWASCEIRKIGNKRYVVAFFRIYAYLGLQCTLPSSANSFHGGNDFYESAD
jgi:hypothetical protein